MIVRANSDRTTLNRKNSAFIRFFHAAKSEKFRFFKHNFYSFLCCYCLILIKLINGSSKIIRTRSFNINVKALFSEKFRFPFVFRTKGNRPRNAFASGKQHEGGRSKLARLISFNPQEARLLLYSGNATSQIPERSEGDTARRKKLKTSLPLIRFSKPFARAKGGDIRSGAASSRAHAGYLRSLDGLFCYPKEVLNDPRN